MFLFLWNTKHDINFLNVTPMVKGDDPQNIWYNFSRELDQMMNYKVISYK